MPKKQQTPEQILEEYEEKSNEIIQQMMQVLLRAQRKADDAAYRKVLEQLEEKK